MMGEESASVASVGLSVDRPSLMAPPDQLTLVADRLHEILITGGTFDAIYRHILAVPGKRVRAGLVLACARLLPSAAAVPLRDAVDLACAIEMFHEASLVHDDICDGSLLRRDAPSVPAAFGVRTAARAGFHLAGNALQVLARVLADNPAVFARLGEAPGVTYLDRISDLSFGQLVETLPPAVDDAALRRHYELVAGAKTGTLFRLACSYGGTAGGRRPRSAARPDAVRRPARPRLPDHGRRARRRGRPLAGQGGRWRPRPPGADLAGDRVAGHAARFS